MKKIVLVLLVILSFTFTQKLNAQVVEPVDEVLELLVQKGIITINDAADLRAKVALQKQEDEKKKKKFSVSAKKPLNIAGYTQIGYTDDKTTGTFDTFRIRRARLTLSGDFSERISYKLQVDASPSPKSVIESVDFAKQKVKTTRVLTPILIDAQLDYKIKPDLKLSIGQFKVPFSLENLASSPRLDTINRTNVVENLTPGRDVPKAQGRDIGILLSGEYSDESGKKILDYNAGIFNGSGINTTDDNNAKDFSTRVVYYPIENFFAGVSNYTGKYGATKLKKERTGLEFSYIKEKVAYPYFLKGEYVNGKDDKTEKAGWYVLTGIKFKPEYEFVARYETLNLDKSISGNKQDITTIGLNYFLTKESKLQVNYEKKKEESNEVKNDSLLFQYQVVF